MSSATTTRNRRLTRGIALLLASVLVLGACLNAEQSQALDRLNADRRANNRTTLSTQSDAQSKAQAWAERLARENRLYHSTLSQGIGVRWCWLAENVGYGSSIAGVQRAFMNSSGHRANVLSTRPNGVGVGVAHNGNRVFVVQVFIQTC